MAGVTGPQVLASPASPATPASPAWEALEGAWEAQRREEVDADLVELEAEEQRLTMPPPLPRLSRREKVLATAARDRQLLPPPLPRLSVENNLARITVI
jgi:hypothetical protein